MLGPRVACRENFSRYPDPTGNTIEELCSVSFVADARSTRGCGGVERVSGRCGMCWGGFFPSRV